ncbi:DUF418 domain-containing protein [uncultured Algibacter sp.]|uniref:DUF418 domain-containing protein n=1 Tax=uncultured Algibacter sp. TaxID=298659 RepID=UPI0026159D6C|nr:DUF418 domain-containing protein [uncultured Algibacter sp.]
MNSIPVKKPRIEVVDALRGFAIMAIMLLHSIEHFNFYVFPDKSTQPDWLNTIDDGIWDTLFFLFGGKGYAIFAILFGFTFSLMYTKQLKLGKDFGYRFLWRMLLLAGFAFINGMFFPGEVLLMYAIVGVTLFIVRHWGNKALLIASFILLLQPVEWIHYMMYVLDNTYTVPRTNMGSYWGFISEGQLSHSFLDLVKSNTLYGHKASLLWAYSVGRLLQTAGLFIFGYWLGKKQLFVNSEKSLKFWKKVLTASILTFIPLYILETNIKSTIDIQIYKDTLFKAIDMYGNLAFTLFLISAFILFYRVDFFIKITNGLRYCGKMSLTAYVFQSIIGGFVFYGYGLALGPSLRHTKSFLLGILLFTFQVYIYRFWLKKFNQGPLEKLWHKLTWINYK